MGDTWLERASDTLAGALSEPIARSNGGYPRAAAIAAVAQAEAAHRQADALERIATALDGPRREFSIEPPDAKGGLTIRYADGTCAIVLGTVGEAPEEWSYLFPGPKGEPFDGGRVTIRWEKP